MQSLNKNQKQVCTPMFIYFSINYNVISHDIIVCCQILQGGEQQHQRKLGKRPIGSTIYQKKKKNDMYVSMVNEISKKYDDLKRTNRKLPNGKFQKIVDAAKEKYGIDKSVSFGTIRSRYCRKKNCMWT